MKNFLINNWTSITAFAITAFILFNDSDLLEGIGMVALSVLCFVQSYLSPTKAAKLFNLGAGAFALFVAILLFV